MSYNNAIPQPTDLFKNSYAQILANYRSLDRAMIGVDNGGLLCTDQAASPATGATNIALYSRVAANPVQATAGFINTLTLRKRNNTAPIEFTGGLLATPGWVRLPNGMLIKWMKVTIPQDNINSYNIYGQTWTVAADIPIFSAVANNPSYFHLTQLSTTTINSFCGGNAYVVEATVTNTTFDIKVNSYSLGFFGWGSFDVFVVAYGQG